VRRWGARAALFFLAVAALSGLWAAHVHVAMDLWPFWTQHHVRVLVFVGGVVCWMAFAAVAIFAAGYAVVTLWRWAE
jgi:hypothetical protein